MREETKNRMRGLVNEKSLTKIQEGVKEAYQSLREEDFDIQDIINFLQEVVKDQTTSDGTYYKLTKLDAKQAIECAVDLYESDGLVFGICDDETFVVPDTSLFSRVNILYSVGGRTYAKVITAISYKDEFYITEQQFEELW